MSFRLKAYSLIVLNILLEEALRSDLNGLSRYLRCMSQALLSAFRVGKVALRQGDDVSNQLPKLQKHLEALDLRLHAVEEDVQRRPELKECFENFEAFERGLRESE